MLEGYPTKNGTGIAIYGTFPDLNILYDLVHKAASTIDEGNSQTKGQFLVLMDFAFEIRKAKEKSRLIEKFSIDNEQITFYGFYVVWTDILFFVNVLRQNIGFIATNRLEQAYLYLLENLIEYSLIEYDAVGGENLKSLINGLKINDKYIFQIYLTIRYNYLHEKNGKKRFKGIHKSLITSTNPFANLNTEIIADLKSSAKELECDIFDIIIGPFPSIKW